MGGKKIAYDWVDKSLKRWADDFDKGKNVRSKGQAFEAVKPPSMPKPKIVREDELSKVTRAKKIYRRLTEGKRTRPEKAEPKEVIRKKKPTKRMTSKELQERNKKSKPKPETKKETPKKKPKKTPKKKPKKDKSVTAPKDDVPF
jgi:hypothetical protein